MRIGIPKEQFAGETRVAATPTTVTQLIKLGFEVAVESSAGHLAKFDDSAYAEAGADVVSREDVFNSNIIYIEFSWWLAITSTSIFTTRSTIYC